MTTSDPTTTTSAIPETVTSHHRALARGYGETYSPTCVSRRSIDVLEKLLDAAYLAGGAAERQTPPRPTLRTVTPAEYDAAERARVTAEIAVAAIVAEEDVHDRETQPPTPVGGEA